MKRLWDKGQSIAEEILRFTAGEDPVIDRSLLSFDCVGSAAHALMLHATGVLSQRESDELLAALKLLFDQAERGEIEIPLHLEDGHTTIEALLTERCGDLGKKIHTGRSRNDQVQVTIRLFLRAWLTETVQALISLSRVFLTESKKHLHVVIPGYTHLQPAMPTSVGIWFAATLEALLESIDEGNFLLEQINKNPLGSGSGFDTGLPLIDKNSTAAALGFSRVQSNPIDVQNSRGRLEGKILSFAATVAGTFEKFAWDVIFYSTKELGIFSLSPTITTGSSLMPQKRNPDVLELIRATAGSIRGAGVELQFVAGKLPSFYHRDLQLTKPPLFRGLASLRSIMQVMPAVLDGITVNESRASECLYPELYATYAVFEKLTSGVPFRDAYRQAAEEIQTAMPDPKKFTGYVQRVIDGYAPRLAEIADELQQKELLIESAVEREKTVREIFLGRKFNS